MRLSMRWESRDGVVPLPHSARRRGALVVDTKTIFANRKGGNEKWPMDQLAI